MTDFERAKEIALKIFGKWAYDHEYGDRKDRAKAKSLHELRISGTARIFLAEIQRVREEQIEKDAKISEEHFLTPFGVMRIFDEMRITDKMRGVLHLGSKIASAIRNQTKQSEKS